MNYTDLHQTTNQPKLDIRPELLPALRADAAEAKADLKRLQKLFKKTAMPRDNKPEYLPALEADLLEAAEDLIEVQKMLAKSPNAKEIRLPTTKPAA